VRCLLARTAPPAPQRFWNASHRALPRHNAPGAPALPLPHRKRFSPMTGITFHALQTTRHPRGDSRDRLRRLCKARAPSHPTRFACKDRRPSQLVIRNQTAYLGGVGALGGLRYPPTVVQERAAGSPHDSLKLLGHLGARGGLGDSGWSAAARRRMRQIVAHTKGNRPSVRTIGVPHR
jgi:hypothetical protein